MQIGLRFLNNYEHNNKQLLFMYINILVAQYHNTSTGNWILKSGKLVGKMASIVHLQPRKLIFFV